VNVRLKIMEDTKFYVHEYCSQYGKDCINCRNGTNWAGGNEAIVVIESAVIFRLDYIIIA
jgi:NADH:ubiquinone oxidoreductase subunit F (NADH-binding)